jgi:hypothetical protein
VHRRGEGGKERRVKIERTLTEEKVKQREKGKRIVDNKAVVRE